MLGSLTEKQDSALQEMLERFPPEEKHKGSQLDLEDYHCDLLRFLRARQFNVNAAAQMYADTLEWRKEVGADDILNDPEIAIRLDDTFHEVISHNYHKYDKKGRPIYFERTGAINMAELVATFTPEQLVRRHIWYMEMQIARMRKSPLGIWNGGTERVEQMTHILDLKGLSMNPSMSIVHVFKECTRIDQTYYPERMGKSLIIGAPALFYGIWSMVTPLLDPVTKEKITIFGSDYEDTLLELIDADQLPVEYGGLCSCPGGCIPTYLDKEVYIGAGSTHEETVELGPQGSTVSWSFQSVSHDISFAVVHKPPSGAKVTLSPPTRHKNTAQSKVKGSVVVPDSGSVSLVFDNSYSYMTGKTIKYRVNVEHQ